MRKSLFLLLAFFVTQTTMSQRAVVDYPYYKEKNSYDDISKLVVDEKETVLQFTLLASSGNISTGKYLFIDKNAALIGNVTGRKYKLLSIDDMTPGDTLFFSAEKGDIDYIPNVTMHFEPLASADTSFDYVENKGSSIMGISTNSYDVAQLRAWGKDTDTPFNNDYIRGYVYIKGKAAEYSIMNGKYNFSASLSYPDITGKTEEKRLKDEFFFTIPVFNTTMLKFSALKHHFIIVEPGDTVEIDFDGKNCDISSGNAKYELLQKEVSDFYNRMWNNHRIHITIVNSMNMQQLYACLQGQLCRRLLSLQKYMEQNPTFSQDAAYLLRTAMKNEVLPLLMKYAKYAPLEENRSLSPQYLDFANELFAASTIPFTMSIAPSLAPIRSLVSYYDGRYRFYRYKDRGNFTAETVRSTMGTMLLEKHRKGEIAMSDDEVEIIKRYPLCYVINRSSKTVDDSIRYAQEIADYKVVCDAFKRICAKYPMVTPTEKEVEEAALNLKIHRYNKIISALPLPEREIKFLRTAFICHHLNQDADATIWSDDIRYVGADAWSRSVLLTAMDGLEEFPLAPIIVEYNEKNRRPGSTEE